MAKTVGVSSDIGATTANDIFPASQSNHYNLGRKSLQVRGIKVPGEGQRCMER
jgi:hypothetical protein